MRSYWQRCIQDAGPGVQARFKESLELFFEAVNVQAQDRDNGVVPDLESYIDLRRDTSGCKPVFDLIEYALRIDLPDSVIEHPVIKALNQGSNDLVTWSNVCIRRALSAGATLCASGASARHSSVLIATLLTHLNLFRTSFHITRNRPLVTRIT